MTITQNAQIMKDLRQQFTMVTIDLYGNGDKEDFTTIVCYASEHSEKDILDLFEKYDIGYNDDTIDCAFVEYLTQENINFYQLETGE